MAEILIHTETLNSSVHKKLMAAGIIPVRVKDAGSVRLLAPEPALVGSDVILRSALKSLASKEWNLETRLRSFVQELADSMKQGD